MTKTREDIYRKLKRLTFKDFKDLAADPNLTDFEKIGFPDEYRKKFNCAILDDICSKVEPLRAENKVIFDIGCGCSELTHLFIARCESKRHSLVLVDSEEMLSLLPDGDFTTKLAGRFPDNSGLFEAYRGKADAVVCYSVMQHVILESNPFHFIDNALELLCSGGVLLLGDIPNISKRKRFFSSEKGIETHKKFTGRDELPKVDFLKVEHECMDDSIIMAILQRYRNGGFETYLIPQPPSLPMFTRREDILIVRP